MGIEEAVPVEPRPLYNKRVAVTIISLCLGLVAVGSWAFRFNHRTQLVEDGGNRGEPFGDVIDEGSWSNIAWTPSECFCSICGYNQDCRPSNIAAGKARVGCNGAVWSNQRAAISLSTQEGPKLATATRIATGSLARAAARMFTAGRLRPTARSRRH